MTLETNCIEAIGAREVLSEYIEVGGGDQCIPGDMDGDMQLDITDVINIVYLVLNGGGYDPCADINGDESINIIDVVSLVNLIIYPPEEDSREDENTDLTQEEIQSILKQHTTVTYPENLNIDIDIDMNKIVFPKDWGK